MNTTPFWYVSAAVSSIDNDLEFSFHVPRKEFITNVFSKLDKSLFSGYTVSEIFTPAIVNGKCFRSFSVNIKKPDFNLLSISEWPFIIKSIMENTFNCRFIFFDDYNEFLNE